jgi:hypothetical protein
MINADLGLVGSGVMRSRFVRCDDGLTYHSKDDEFPGLHIRATELFWCLIARQIALPVPVPQILSKPNGQTVFATRREKYLAASAHEDSKTLFVNGSVQDGGRQIARLYGFDLFCGNEDRKPDNYLLLHEEHGIILQGIDHSHAALLPGISNWPGKDPLYDSTSYTRVYLPVVISSYQSDRKDIEEIIDRLEGLQSVEIETILKQIPDDWLTDTLRSDMLVWWKSDAKAERIKAIRTGITNGTLF